MPWVIMTLTIVAGVNTLISSRRSCPPLMEEATTTSKKALLEAERENKTFKREAVTS